MFFRKSIKPFLLLIFPILFMHTSLLIASETVYISDRLIVKVRADISLPSEVVDKVQSDERVTVLEDKGKYLHIKTRNGAQGWIESQYVKDEPPKSLVIKQLTQELNDMREKMQAIDSLGNKPSHDYIHRDELIQITHERDILAAELENLRKQIETTKDTPVFNSTESRSTTITSVTRQRPQQKFIQHDIHDAAHTFPQSAHLLDSQFFDQFSPLSDQQTEKNDLYWFLAGATVFLTGILSGRLTGRGKKRRIFFH